VNKEKGKGHRGKGRNIEDAKKRNRENISWIKE
jgi:hypothetical protein